MWRDYSSSALYAAEDDKATSLDDSSSSPTDSPRQQSHRGSGAGSWSHTSVWPQSYRQSMDIYSNVTSPSLSLLSPSITQIGASYLSSSFRRHPKSSNKLSSSFLPTKDDKSESQLYEQVPLLRPIPPAFKGPEVFEDTVSQGCSAAQAALNGINVLCGVGVLTTPYAVKEGGWLGLGILFIFAIVSWYTGLLLRHCLDSHEGMETYPDIGQAAFGMTGRLIISIILYMELYACCVEFLIMEGDNLSALFPNAHLTFNGYEVTAAKLFTILTAILLLPTMWLRDLSLLSYVSAGGVVASILVVICVTWVGVVDGVGFLKSGPLINFANLPLSIGLYGFCYSGHAVFPNIYKSLRNPTQFTTILTTSFIICTTMYAGVAVMGFTMFGEDTQSQITLNLPNQFVASKIALWTIVVNPFTKYALTLTPVALSLEELLPSNEYNMKSYWASLGIRTLLVISTLCVALLVPFFGYIMAFIGSFLSMMVCLIFPAACFLKIVGIKVTLLQNILCVFIILIGSICVVAGTYSSLSGIIESFSS